MEDLSERILKTETINHYQDKNIEALDKKVESVESKVDRLRNWIMGQMAFALITLAGVITTLIITINGG